MNNTSNLVVDKLQQQETTSGYVPVGQKRESEAVVSAGLLKPDSRRLVRGGKKEPYHLVFFQSDSTILDVAAKIMIHQTRCYSTVKE